MRVEDGEGEERVEGGREKGEGKGGRRKENRDKKKGERDRKTRCKKGLKKGGSTKKGHKLIMRERSFALHSSHVSYLAITRLAYFRELPSN